MEYFNHIYAYPYTRINPYLVGLVLGYILVKDFKIQFSGVAGIVSINFLWIILYNDLQKHA